MIIGSTSNLSTLGSLIGCVTRGSRENVDNRLRMHVIREVAVFWMIGNMKKFVLVASALSLGMLSLNAAAGGNDGHHGAAMEQHEDSPSAIGKPGDVAKVTRTVTVEMNDAMRFKPATIKVSKGDTIKFVVRNVGKLKHEMVIGSIKELQEHAAMMKQMPEMEHADANRVTVDPGKSADMIWQFTKAGTFEFACLQPGHWEAGMKGKLKVAAK